MMTTEFFDRRAGIASGLFTVGTVSAMLGGQAPAKVARAISQRAAALGDSVAAAMERIQRAIGDRFPRANTAMNSVVTALT